MAISYPVDVANTEWATLQLSTGEITARRRKWPNVDGSEIVGLDPDFVMLLHVDFAPPQYDSRLYLLETVETVDAEDNEIRRTYRTVKRPVDEQKTAAENVETQQLSQFFRLERQMLETTLMLGAVMKFAINQEQLPNKIATKAQAYIRNATKLWRNRDRLEEILSDIENGTEPDLDAGWETPE